ncbi:hypothetical protein [Paraburkholderia elongata]|uniref:Uncharacterized protein n=1 Tax=Paraburkholderia elongata TaxID=2675747 RepID=A0A972NZ46_9BURK|nr:hypothetical protein [Paraburkholderia elongata]NPT62538.1 hypothetical protein [Paraburkholderia elongata]
MASVNGYGRLSNVLQGKTKRNRCVACVAVSVARNPAGSLELPSQDARKTQHRKTYQILILGTYGAALRDRGNGKCQRLSTPE